MRRIWTRREFVAAAALSLAACGLGGCTGSDGGSGGVDASTGTGGSDSASSSKNAGNAAGQDAGAQGGAATITDGVGRTVTIEQSPDRVAVLDSFSGELAVMVGAGSKMVAVPSGVKSDVLLQGLYSDLVDLPAPMSNGAINMEELMKCSPQAVIVKQEVYEAAGQKDLLDKSGLPYVVIGYTSIDEQIEAIGQVAAVFGGEAQERAGRIAQYYRDVVEDCRNRASQLRDEERVRVYHAVNALVATDGADSLGRDWIESVGCVDVSSYDDAPAADYNTTLEQIYVWDPDVIIANSADTTKYLMSRDNCSGLKAVRKKSCHTIPVGAARWGQRGSVETYLGMLWLGCTVYPQLYADVDLQQRITDYYRDYLGIEVTNKLYKQILSGEGLRQQSKQAG